MSQRDSADSTKHIPATKHHVETLLDAVDDGREVQVTLDDGTEFVGEAVELRHLVPLAENADPGLDASPPYGEGEVTLDVDADALPSEQEGLPYSAIITFKEESAGGWGRIWVSWATQIGSIVGGPDESKEETRDVESIEVVSED